MAPKPHAASYLSDSRIDELNEMLGSHGLEKSPVGGLEFLDRAMKDGWKLPSVKALQQHVSGDAKAPKKLVTVAVHMAREHLGEPVGAKKQDA